jgi:DNA-binding Lrp family transcriptional regulator
VSSHTRDIHEEKRASKTYLKSRLKKLRDAGISGPHASRDANAEVRALTAVFDFFETLDELHDAGKTDVAGAVWVIFSACCSLSFRRRIGESSWKQF